MNGLVSLFLLSTLACSILIVPVPAHAQKKSAESIN